MTRRTFGMPEARSNPPESGVWFHLDFAADGQITGIEEHDGYAGGPITPANGETHENLIKRRIKSRALPGRENDEYARFIAWRAAQA